MSTAPQTKPPSPAIVFDTLNGYLRTAALRGAIELDLFTAIAEGNSTPDAIARRMHTSEKGTRVLCDYLTVIGLLTKQASNYSLTPESATFLNRNSPAYIGTATGFLSMPEMTAHFRDIGALVRKGGVLNDAGTTSPDNPVWVEFARSMAPVLRMPSELLAQMLLSELPGECRVLDLAAGHGLFGVAIARHNPKARVVAVDWAPVLAVATENAQKAGVAERHTTLPGSAFDVDFGTGYDIVLLTNFISHFDTQENETLLRKLHAALNPGGVAITLAFIPNEDRISPPLDATFALIMLGTTPSGDAYTFPEYEAMFRNSGFARSELRVLSPSPQRVIVSYK
jgi:SAM-dependent methyltransferase